MSDKPRVGSIVWQDLTVENATDVRDFYCDVVGWTATDQNMGEYADYNIEVPGGDAVAGVCHARGSNANMPAQWMIYVVVESVERSAARCVARGGEVVDGPRPMGKRPFCVIRDPAGAVLALIEG